MPPREHEGFDLLIQKLSMEGLTGVKPLLPDPRFGQDVALVAFTIDRLRARRAPLRRAWRAVVAWTCEWRTL